MARTVGMFLGAETAGWSLQQFTDAARLAKSLGCTVLAVKCQDGPVVWYDSQGGIGAVRQACLAGGLDMVPYAYLYGRAVNDKGEPISDFPGEIAGVKRLFGLTGKAMVDLEQEWNGHPDWAAEFNAAIGPIPNTYLYLTTWANPATQNWLTVIAAIRDCVNCWVPQEYDTFLVGTEGQFSSGLVMQPAVNLPEQWPGPNDPVAAAKTAVSRGHDGVWLWEYQLAVNNRAVVQEIAAVMNGMTTGSTTVGVPSGWTDDGSTLTAPNGVRVVHGFRDYVLAHNWDPKNWPIELEHAESPMELGNPSIQPGTQQCFRWSVLEWNSASNVFEMWTGQEILASRKALEASLAQHQTDQAALEAAQQQITDLQNQIAQLKANPPADPNASAALKIITALKALESQIS